MTCKVPEQRNMGKVYRNKEQCGWESWGRPDIRGGFCNNSQRLNRSFLDNVETGFRQKKAQDCERVLSFRKQQSSP